MEYSRGEYRLMSYQVTKVKQNIQQQDQDPITRQMLPYMALNVHVEEMGGIFKGSQGVTLTLHCLLIWLCCIEVEPS
jgi:hypothetical protein